MSKKGRGILFIQIASSIVGILIVLLILVKIVDWIEWKQVVDQSVQNVFDEMVVNDAIALRKSTNVWNVQSYRPHENYMHMEYKSIEGDISSNIWIYFDDTSGLTKPAPLYITFAIYDKEGNFLDAIDFTYYESVNKLYISGGEKKTISWEELESYKDYLLYDIIIGSYLDNRRSLFSMDNLGEFEIIDYLMPYEYCGMPDREVNRTEVNDQGVSYITWLDTDSMLCIQQKIQQEIQYDDERLLHVVLCKVPFMLTDEVFGRYTGASRFVVQIEGKDCMLSDLVEINDDFIEWMKDSGQAEGNLQRISPDRETGGRETQQMLQYFPEEKMQIILEHCEFYIEPGYLHIRFPYWDYELKEPAFVMNGNDLWRGWLTVRTDDIERFLKVEKW